ncbi:zinc metalloproteinase nas-6-like [Porites lutea]|uniref:zinc metalloproteinase nas-6-like n=1 Tax=Porites lutea TaxID=51062 RepID=UPI003CC5AA15
MMFRAIFVAVFLQLAKSAFARPGNLQSPPPPGSIQEGRKATGENRTAFEVILLANNDAGNLRLVDRNNSLHEGDILLTKRQKSLLGVEQGNSRRYKRAAMRSLARRWISGGQAVVPYQLEGSVGHARRVISAAIQHWERNVPCLKFVPRSSHRNYVSFFAGGGCYSMVGRVGGQQKISIGRGCEYLHTVIHEIGHALGFWHEQSRPDRDRYINIHWNNIPTGFRSQFTKMSESAINSRGVGYDYDSVMHYHSTAFGNGRITITRKDGSTKLGNTRGLSPKDIEQARKMYCGSTPTNRPVTQRPPWPSTPPSGCQDSNNKCPTWARNGHCRGGQWQNYMKTNCKRSCGLCNGCQHADNNSNCPYWAKKGYCRGQWQRFMETNCKKSCKCKDNRPCTDKRKSCNSWARSGYCNDRRYAVFMAINCKKTCNKC